MKPLYTPWPARARRSWGWAAPLVVLTTYGLSIIPAIVVAGIVGVGLAVAGGQGVDAASLQTDPRVILPTLLAQFIAWGGLIVWWAGGFERRGLATLGLGGANWLLRYGRGLLVGAALVALLMGAGMTVSALFPVEGAAETAQQAGQAGQADFNRLLQPAAIGFLALMALVFLVQGGMEEVVFRGWLMSTLTARWGVVAAVTAATLIFMGVHAHVFISGAAYGAVVIAGLGATGLFFGLYALAERSIAGPIAAHGAFNVCVLGAPTALQVAASEDADILAVFGEVLTTATATGGPEAVTMGPATFVQLAVFSMLSLVMMFGLALRAQSERTGG